MKNRISLLTAIVLFFGLAAPLVAHEVYQSQFLGVCQKCGRDIIAYWRPVECLDGRVEWQWVEDVHCHCRPAYKGRKKWRFIDSPLANPANDKGWRAKHCKSLKRTNCCD